MLSNVKLWLYGAAAGLVALLFGWLKLTQAQRDKARVEAEKQARARFAEKAKYNQAQSVSKARIAAAEEAKHVETENNSNRGKRPAGNFGDKRL